MLVLRGCDAMRCETMRCNLIRCHVRSKLGTLASFSSCSQCVSGRWLCWTYPTTFTTTLEPLPVQRQSKASTLQAPHSHPLHLPYPFCMHSGQSLLHPSAHTTKQHERPSYPSSSSSSTAQVDTTPRTTGAASTDPQRSSCRQTTPPGDGSRDASATHALAFAVSRKVAS